MDEYSFEALRERIGDEHLGQRMRAQVDHSVQLMGMGRGRFHLENVPLFIRLVERVLRVTGLVRQGRRNALAFRIRENQIKVQHLPPAFDGLHILHLSDLHVDGYLGFGQLVAQAIAGLAFDLCVLTGDFRFYGVGQYERVTAELAALMPALACRYGVYGVLGNHDFVEMVPTLEDAGIRTLINESVALDAGGTKLWLVGLDDPHFYGLHDFDKALRNVPQDAARILLVHSPELISEASARGFDLYLAGHTHGGQICLPGGWPLLVNARCLRRYVAGAWQLDGVAGYTSVGVGSSGVFARYFCPPEIVVHHLGRQD